MILFKKICFKNVPSPYYIDLFITISSLIFPNTVAVSPGSLDLYKIVVIVFKMEFNENIPKVYFC